MFWQTIISYLCNSLSHYYHTKLKNAHIIFYCTIIII
nr:MAG TPA: hypothetical protein [Caudoviricetes sp.]